MGWQKAEVAPGAQRERSRLRLKAAERQGEASSCDFRGASSVSGGIRSCLRARRQGAHLIGGCAPGRSPVLWFQEGRGREVEDSGRAGAVGARTR